MWIEKYFSMLSKDIDESTEALTATLPDTVRSGLEEERRKLLSLHEVLTGKDSEYALRSLRANLRWRKHEALGERDAVKRKHLEKEVADLEKKIATEVERQKMAKG